MTAVQLAQGTTLRGTGLFDWLIRVAHRGLILTTASGACTVSLAHMLRSRREQRLPSTRHTDANRDATRADIVRRSP